MLALLLPQLLTAAVLLAVILYAAHRAKADAAELHRRLTAESDAFAEGLLAEARAAFEATKRPAPAPVYLEVTFDVPAGTDAGEVADKVERLIASLNEFERALGGAGVTRDPARSAAAGGAVTLALAPNDPTNAEFRLAAMRKVAEAAGEFGSVPMRAEVKRMAA